MQSTQRYRAKGKFSFRSVVLEVTVGRFPQNFTYPSRLKVNFQAERFKLLAIRSVSSKKAKFESDFCPIHPKKRVDFERSLKMNFDCILFILYEMNPAS
uniref:Uncharacterized protein n=1 Tax=Romanomermis culicivorax TaxID=13658 RepID=A0A915KVK5_ROMCU